MAVIDLSEHRRRRQTQPTPIFSAIRFECPECGYRSVDEHKACPRCDIFRPEPEAA